MSIRGKILVFFIIAIFMAGGVSMLIGRAVATDIIEDEIRAHLVTTANSRAHHIETVLQQRADNMELFISQIQLIQQNAETSIWEDIPSYSFVAAGVANSSDTIDAVMFLDENGSILISSDQLNYPIGTDLNSGSFFSMSREGIYVGRFDIDEKLDDFVLVSAAPLALSKDGSRMGSLVLLGGQDVITQITTDVTGLGETGEVYLVNEYGVMITPSRFMDDAVLTQEVNLTGLEKTSPKSETQNGDESGWTVVTTTNYLGSRVLGVYYEMPGSGWTLVVEKSRQEVFSPVSGLTNIMISSLLGVFVIGMIISILLSRTLSRPIERLHRGTEEIMRGNWDCDVSTAAKDEIGQLSRAFSTMTAKLRQSHEELQRYSSGLEKKIAEREVLLKEIHHRVKNNLQIICSLLSLQRDGIKDEASRMLFDESQNRVRSMALIHERLYQSGDLAQIDFSDYVRALTGQLVRSYSNGSSAVNFKMRNDDVFLNIDTAMPCGLIINELITNSLKYAFPNGRGGPGENGHSPEVTIELTRSDDHRLNLVVADNGIGLPQDLDYRNTETLGMQLVTSLVDQLGATVDVERDGGVTFRISLPEVEVQHGG